MYRRLLRTLWGWSLCKGSIHTVERIAPAITGGYVVVLLEPRPWTTFTLPWGAIDVGFELKRFRYLDIPKSSPNCSPERRRNWKRYKEQKTAGLA